MTSFFGILFAFASTVIATALLKEKLPRDVGRAFAHDGKLSAGKPRGAGIIFVLCFVASALLFVPVKVENLLYLLLVTVSMLTGYLDDAAKNPWGEYKKGILDLVVAAAVAVTYLVYNPNTVHFAFLGTDITLHPVLYGIAIVVLVWASVNVTNCADGVDGLSGTLTMITLMSIYFVTDMLGKKSEFTFMIVLFAICILAYLWFNATPSILMMGDAGSRAMGLFISIAILKTGAPFLYLPLALVLILDGGLGLLKVSLIRFLKIHIMTKIRTPLHDHVRKIWTWSNTQTVFRFAIIQIMLCASVIYGLGACLK